MMTTFWVPSDKADGFLPDTDQAFMKVAVCVCVKMLVCLTYLHAFLAEFGSNNLFIEQ